MLTDKAIRGAKPREKPYRLADSQGLVLIVDPRGGRYWRYRYRIGGKQKQISLGVYPEVSLKNARDKLIKVRTQVADGLDPSAVRKAEKVEQASRKETFGDIAEEYWAQHIRSIANSTQVRDRRILDKLLGQLRDRPTADIDTPEILATLRTIESKGTYETTHRALGLASRIYEYAIATGKATRDATSGLRKAIAPVVSQPHAAITDPKKFGALLRAIDGYSGQPATIAALKLLPYVFTRPIELRQSKWTEFDLEAADWRIPAERMKTRREHLVPLANQSVQLLGELQVLTGSDDFVFPSLRQGRPLSENTINAALRTMGYDGRTHVSHGFRSTASTLLHEMQFPSQVIELQLAHVDSNKVRAVYNRAERLPERRKMMQAWADYIDSLRAGRKVSTLRAAGGRKDAG